MPCSEPMYWLVHFKMMHDPQASFQKSASICDRTTRPVLVAAEVHFGFALMHHLNLDAPVCWPLVGLGRSWFAIFGSGPDFHLVVL